MSLHRCVAALGFLLVVASASASAAIPAQERQVLLDLYTSANGASWTNNSGWNGAAGTECTWAAITCDGAGDHVTRIEMPANNLVGTLPAITNLTALTYLDVGNNSDRKSVV